MKLSFTKMQGCANDYIYLDCRASGVPADIAALAQRLSARHFSVGADGIICICAPVTPGADGRMRIFNADGSEAEKSGNGMGIFAKYLRDAGYVQKTTISWKTLGGEETVFYLNEDATRPYLLPTSLPQALASPFRRR